MPEVTIITPCYNTGKYLQQQIQSLKKQTLTDWEAVYVDDCSTDNTWDILSQASKEDERIRVHRLEKNSGSAKAPRDMAARLSEAPWICNIDADDWVTETYLEQLFQRQQETDADIVCSSMVGTDDKGEGNLFSLPRPPFDFNKVYTSEEAVCMTLLDWNLPMGGYLLRKEIYCGRESFKNPEMSHMNADELGSREILSLTKRVAVCKAIYYYRQNSNSISHNEERSVDIVITDALLLDFTRNNYGSDSSAYRKAHSSYIINLFRTAKKIEKGIHASNEILNVLKQGFSTLSISQLFRADIPLMRKFRFLARLSRYKKMFTD